MKEVSTDFRKGSPAGYEGVSKVPRYHDNFQEIPDIFVHKLKVKEADAHDVGLNIARFDSSSLILMGLQIGDIVVITGRNGRKGAVKCLDSMLLEIEPTLRIDKVLRCNLGFELGNTITHDSITLAKPLPSDSKSEIVLEPLAVDVPPMVNEHYILQSLQGIPLTRGQIILVPYFGGKWYPYAVAKIEIVGKVGSVIVVGQGTRVTTLL